MVWSAIFGTTSACGPTPSDAGTDDDAGVEDAGSLEDAGTSNDAGVALTGPAVLVESAHDKVPFSGATVTLRLADGGSLVASTDGEGYARFRELDSDAEFPFTIVVYQNGLTVRVIVGVSEADLDESGVFVVGTWQVAYPARDRTRLFGDASPLPGGTSTQLYVTISHSDATQSYGLGPTWELEAPRGEPLTLVAVNQSGGAVVDRGFDVTPYGWATTTLQPVDEAEHEVDLDFGQSPSTSTASFSFALPAFAPLADESFAWSGVSTKRSLGSLRTGIATHSAIEGTTATIALEYIELADDPSITYIVLTDATRRFSSQIARAGIVEGQSLALEFLPVPELVGGEATSPLVWGEPWSFAGALAGVPLLVFVYGPVAHPGGAPIRVDFLHPTDELVMPELPVEVRDDPTLALGDGPLVAFPMWCEFDTGITDGTKSWCDRLATGGRYTVELAD